MFSRLERRLLEPSKYTTLSSVHQQHSIALLCFEHDPEYIPLVTFNFKRHVMQATYSIIITDDDLDDQEFLITAIKQLRPNSEIRTANDGLQLLDMLLKKNAFENSRQPLPDLIILDLNMPIIDGYDVLKQMKSNDELKHIPVFILTTSTNECDETKAVAYGAKAFYSKPMVASNLVDIMKTIFSNVPLSAKT